MMGNSVLKEKIYSLIDSSNPETLQAVYQLLKESDYNNDFKSILNEELADYKKNGKVVTSKEMDDFIRTEMNRNV